MNAGGRLLHSIKTRCSQVDVVAVVVVVVVVASSVVSVIKVQALLEHIVAVVVAGAGH